MELEHTENINHNSKTRRLAGKKVERDEVEELRRRVSNLEVENRNLYEQAFLLQQRLETTNATEKERANFISTVAHELRTPLTSIKGYIDLILEGETGDINDVQREFLTIVGANSNKLASIIGDLLDVSRLETGRTSPKFSLTDLVSMSQSLTDSVRPQFEAKGITFKPAIPLGGHLEMIADRDRLLQALRALLAQAGLYTAQNGVVGFTLNRGFEPNKAEIVISDDGPEIAPEDLPRVFTKFFRPSFSIPYAEGTTTTEGDRDYAGTGLGLAIAKAIIEMHHGTIRVESEAGLGNRFIITLPLLNNAESEADVETAPSTPSSVLVVSQDVGFAQALHTILRSEGFQVVVAQEREEVVAETPAWQPDLIIENGLEFGQSALSNSHSPTSKTVKTTPILTLSLSELEQRAFKLGVLGVLPWPTEEPRLKSEFGQMLAGELDAQSLSNFMAAQIVLFVSPDSDILRAFDKVLRDFGLKRIYRATLASDALALARRYRPTLLLVATGKEASTIELLEELSSDPLLQNTSTVIFTDPENIAVTNSPQYQTGSNLEGVKSMYDTNGGSKETTLNTLPKPLTRRRLINVARRLAVGM